MSARILAVGLAVMLGAGAFSACTSFDASLAPDPADGAAASEAAAADADAAAADAVADGQPTELPLVATFGERPSALVKNVTTDTELHALLAEQTLNYGLSETLIADSNPGEEKIALLRFDLSAVPLDRKVMKATLKLYTSGDQGCDAQGGDTVPAFRLLEQWDEGTGSGTLGAASYLRRTSGLAWTSTGAGVGSRSATAEGSFAPSAVGSEFELDLTAAVAMWTANPGINFGIALTIRGTGAAGDGVCFLSAQSKLLERRPLLTITFAR